MFQSEPICILTAGATIDGREISQKIIDEIAEGYDPKRYTARINDDHSDWSWKGGSVLSVEKRNDELWAVIKPNSHLLRNIENDQLLHTSCEFYEDFANTGKAYLTGLAFTDEPASLGTTQVHLSANNENKKKTLASTGHTLNVEQLSSQSNDEESLLHKLYNLLKLGPDAQTTQQKKEQLSQQQEEDEMSKEVIELLKQSIEQNTELRSDMSKVLEKLSSQSSTDEQVSDEEVESTDNSEVTKLNGKVEKLSTQVEELVKKLSNTTDEEQRTLAGEDNDEYGYL